MNTTDSVVRILVADDNELIREGLCSLLRGHPGWLVIGEATNGKDAVEKAIMLKPDVILIDVSMPDLNGFEVASRIHQQLPASKMLIVTEYDSRSLTHIEPQPGVSAYILKSRVGCDLIPAVEAASEDQRLTASASAPA